MQWRIFYLTRRASLCNKIALYSQFYSFIRLEFPEFFYLLEKKLEWGHLHAAKPTFVELP
ncbi:hypothetical protein [cyanobacterium endosymbiont of Rhopalodia gibberula]|uniref:hypothetical protein n=1 Tax=cyanobacterium endosymbiont of Rhopalodia gibberula TaxID=1763363 RepID=UPI0011AB71D4|nr:hypothetical protein [cyanobacterium endosymbiont of Rhopalodia gibberula]